MLSSKYSRVVPPFALRQAGFCIDYNLTIAYQVGAVYFQNTLVLLSGMLTMTQMPNKILRFICKIHNKGGGEEVPRGAGYHRLACYPDKFFAIENAHKK